MGLEVQAPGILSNIPAALYQDQKPETHMSTASFRVLRDKELQGFSTAQTAKTKKIKKKKN